MNIYQLIFPNWEIIFHFMEYYFDVVIAIKNQWYSVIS